MKRLRRVAAFLIALVLGLAAWFTVLICYPSRGELSLSRQLSTGMLIARVPEPRSYLFGRVNFGSPQLSGRYFQTALDRSGPIPPGVVLAELPKNGERIWRVRLDPLDKSWEIEVVEKRSVFVRFGRKSWRIGTKTRVWRTDRALAGEKNSTICFPLPAAS